LCPGETNGDIESSGSVKSRLGGYFNEAAFCAAPQIGPSLTDTGYGNSSDGVVRGPMQDNSDFTISRLFSLDPSEKRSLDFSAQFFNGFNHPQYNDPLTSWSPSSAPTFGQILSTSVAPRIIQFTAKISF
jgi:hypothetical protein